MLNKEKYNGIIPPIVTPLTENEKLDESGLKRLIDHCINGGCEGIFVNGSCGEAMRITDDVWEAAMKVTVSHVGGRVPVFCGAIDSSTSRQLEKIHKIKDAGGEVAVCTVPFYHGNNSEEEVVKHYNRLCEEGEMKIALYNIPATTHKNISLDTTKEIIKNPNIAVIKDSCADFQQIQRELKEVRDKDIAFFNGAEELVGAVSLYGANGSIPGLSCFLPELFVSLHKAGQEQNVAETIRLQEKATRFRDTLYVGKSWIASMKYMLEYFGLAKEVLSYPFSNLNEEEKEKIREIIQEVTR